MNVHKLAAFVIVFSLSLIVGCTYYELEPVEVKIPDEPVSFAEDIQPIFTQKCIVCHSSIPPVLEEGKAFSSLLTGAYVIPNDPENSPIIIKTSGNHPPASNALSPEEKALLKKWIAEGAKEN